LKIVHLIPALTKGGAERVLVELANQAAREGHDVAVIAGFAAPPELLAQSLLPNVRYMAISPAGRSRGEWYAAGVAWAWRNRAWLAANDVIHCHLTFASLVGTLLGWWWKVAVKKAPRIVETIHAVGMPITPAQRRRIAFFARRRAGVALMARDAFWLAFAESNPQIPVAFIANGIGAPTTQPAGSRERVREALGVPRKALVVGTIGRMVAERMPEALLSAFATMPARVDGNPVHLVMGGAGPLVEPLRAASRDRNLQDRVHFPGLVEDPASMLSAFDLYLSVNVGEVTGIAGLEAAAAGLPVVALQALAGREADADDWIWSSSDIEEVGRRMTLLLQDRSAAAALAIAQNRHVIDHHGAAAMFRSYLELYRAAGATVGAADIAASARSD
jgi:glycosyltransferase involved in cell wall biosynthesis